MKIILQDGIKDCGICCLLSIIRFYGGDVSREYLRELTNTTKDGVTLYNLMYAAQKIGFSAVGLSGKIEDIKVDNLPCIAHININKNIQHFIVIYKINSNKHEVTIMDPSKGKKIISFSEYNLLSSNNYLFLTPNKQLPHIGKKHTIYRGIKETILLNKKTIIIITLLTIDYFILNILVSFHFKYLLEYSINYKISDFIPTFCIMIGIIYFFKNSVNYIKYILLNKWNSLLNIHITNNTYKQMLLLPYLYFKNRTTGEVISRFKDLNAIIMYLSNIFSTTITDLVSIIIFSIIIIHTNIYLSYIIIIHVMFFIILVFIFRKYKFHHIKKLKRNEDIINSYIIQGVSNVDTIKGSHLEKRFIDKFTINYKSFQEQIYQHNIINYTESFLSNLIHDSMYIFLYGIGSYLVIKGDMSLSALIVYQSITTYYIGSITNVINAVSMHPEYKTSLDRVEELFMLDSEDFKNNYFYLPYVLDGNITIKNLSYKIGTKEIFNNLSLTIKQGEKILLGGESGCGKSTLMKILLRYIEVQYDTVKISNIDINHYHLQNIRSNITYITSNEYLFNDSIKNNICLYKEYPEDELLEICKICSVDDIANDKTLYLDTIIEENGFNLSNGERQRIILARSLLKKTSIYIFDEALAQIDIHREKRILESIFKYLAGKTIIVISHRFNNKKLFDRVIKLEGGVIVEN